MSLWLVGEKLLARAHTWRKRNQGVDPWIKMIGDEAKSCEVTWMVSVSQSVTCTRQPPRPSASQPASQSALRRTSPHSTFTNLPNLHLYLQLIHRTFAFRTHWQTCSRRYINIHAVIRTHEPPDSPSIGERASAQPSDSLQYFTLYMPDNTPTTYRTTLWPTESNHDKFISHDDTKREWIWNCKYRMVSHLFM